MGWFAGVGDGVNMGMSVRMGVCTGVGVGGREQLKVTTSTHQVFCDLDARFCSCMDVVSNGVIVPRPYIVRSVSEWARILVNT